VEARDNLVAQTNKIAAELGPEFRGLNFVEGNILDYFSLDLPTKREEVAGRSWNEQLGGEKVGEKKGEETVGGKIGGKGVQGEAQTGTQEGDKWVDSVKKVEKTLRSKDKKASLDSNKMDVLIALHACDTATDDAIWCGIQGGAQIIGTALNDLQLSSANLLYRRFILFSIALCDLVLLYVVQYCFLFSNVVLCSVM
jgi:Methyltransferase domain